MPATNKAKNPSGIEIEFEEATHIYKSIINNIEIKYTSGTQFLHNFFPKFDPTGEITKRCAAKEGLTVEAIKEKWAAKGKESCRLGTRMHETIEDILLGNKLRNSPEDITEKARFDNAINIAKKIKNSIDILGVEKIVFDHRLKIAGTIDLFGKSRKDGSFLIIDHKSNQIIERDNKYKKFCLDPISDIPDVSFWHYALQLNLYQFLLIFGGYVPKKSTFKLYLNHVTELKQELIQLPDLQTQIKDLLIQYLIKV